MPDETLSDLIDEMRNTAREAARAAAGKVVGERIAAAHPDLPPLIWGADDGWSWGDYRPLMWHATAYVDTHDDVETRAIVAAYARALEGSDPRKVDMGKFGTHLVTVGSFCGVQITVIGVLP
jgi:hypothetical protein